MGVYGRDVVGLGTGSIEAASGWVTDRLSPQLTQQTSDVRDQTSDGTLASTRAAFNQALEHVMNQDWKPGASLAESIVKAVPESACGWFLLGACAFRMGDIHLSHDAFSTGLKLNPYIVPAAVHDAKNTLPSPTMTEEQYNRVGTKILYLLAEWGSTRQRDVYLQPPTEFEQIGCASDGGAGTGHVVALFQESSTVPLVKHRFLLSFDTDLGKLLWREEVDHNISIAAVSPAVVMLAVRSRPLAFSLRDPRTGTEMRYLSESSFRHLVWPEWPTPTWQEGFSAAHALKGRRNEYGVMLYEVLDPWRPNRRFLGSNISIPGLPGHVPIADPHSGTHLMEVPTKKPGASLGFLNWN